MATLRIQTLSRHRTCEWSIRVLLPLIVNRDTICSLGLILTIFFIVYTSESVILEVCLNQPIKWNIWFWVNLVLALQTLTWLFTRLLLVGVLRRQPSVWLNETSQMVGHFDNRKFHSMRKWKWKWNLQQTASLAISVHTPVHIEWNNYLITLSAVK